MNSSCGPMSVDDLYPVIITKFTAFVVRVELPPYVIKGTNPSAYKIALQSYLPVSKR